MTSFNLLLKLVQFFFSFFSSAINIVLLNEINQGINGILADEMGLGKTVQTIATLSHLAEVHYLHLMALFSLITDSFNRQRTFGDLS